MAILSGKGETGNAKYKMIQKLVVIVAIFSDRDILRRVNFFKYLAGNRLPSKKEKILVFILAAVFVYAVYTISFASDAALKFLGAHNIDKIPHVLAGIIIAGTYEWASQSRGFRALALMFIFVAIGWEIFEISFIPDVRYFYQISPELWRLDTIGDITADFLGTYGYWVFAMRRTG